VIAYLVAALAGFPGMGEPRIGADVFRMAETLSALGGPGGGMWTFWALWSPTRWPTRGGVG